MHEMKMQLELLAILIVSFSVNCKAIQCTQVDDMPPCVCENSDGRIDLRSISLDNGNP